jgi:ammonium transporter, Amt family
MPNMATQGQSARTKIKENLMSQFLRLRKLGALLPLVSVVTACPAWAADTPPVAINAGDTAWMLISTALVLMMTIPGLALFYGGLVRRMNVLATVMQSFAICCLVAVLWVVVGYSLAFTNGTNLVGDLSRVLFMGSDYVNAFTLGAGSSGPVPTTIPESVFMMFQMTFAIITPALITGAFADRMKFSAMLWFMGLWSLLVYAPVAHWVWHPNGFLFSAGVLDFAGGTVVHINAGIAALVAAVVLGKRLGYPTENFAPHNLVLSLIGASLLWVGWFGFNAGSALAANGRAGMAMAVTMVAAAAAALAWMFAEWGTRGKPSVLGAISGAVAGLVAITPASGFVDVTGALAIGAVAGVICFWSATWLKMKLGYDDSLDAFGVHGVGGIIGAVLTGVFATSAITGDPKINGLIDGNGSQVLVQLQGIGATIGWSLIGTFVILKVLDLVIGLRVSREVERDGLDVALHGESMH